MPLERAALLAFLLASAPLVAPAEEMVGPRTRVDVGGDLDVYADNGPVPANRLLEGRLFGQIGRRLTKDFTLAGGLEGARYFGLVNGRANLESYWHALSRLDLYGRVASALAPAGSQFLPQWEGTLGAEVPVIGPLTLTLLGSHRYYTANQGNLVDSIQPGLRLDLGVWTLEGHGVFGWLRPNLGDPSSSATGVVRGREARRRHRRPGLPAVLDLGRVDQQVVSATAGPILSSSNPLIGFWPMTGPA